MTDEPKETNGHCCETEKPPGKRVAAPTNTMSPICFLATFRVSSGGHGVAVRSRRCLFSVRIFPGVSVHHHRGPLNHAKRKRRDENGRLDQVRQIKS